MVLLLQNHGNDLVLKYSEMPKINRLGSSLCLNFLQKAPNIKHYYGL